MGKLRPLGEISRQHVHTHEHERSSASEDTDTNSEKSDEKIRRTFAIKPMNCPGPLNLQKLVALPALPVRLAEFGSCIRTNHQAPCMALCACVVFRMTHIFCTGTNWQRSFKIL